MHGRFRLRLRFLALILRGGDDFQFLFPAVILPSTIPPSSSTLHAAAVFNFWVLTHDSLDCKREPPGSRIKVCHLMKKMCKTLNKSAKLLDLMNMQVKHSGCSNMKEKRVKNLTQKTTNDCNLDKMRCNEGFRVQGSNHVPHSVGSNQNKRKMAFTDEIDNNEKIVKSSMKNLKEDCKKKVAFIDEIDNNEKIVNSSMQNSREDYKKKVAITDEIDNNKKTVMQNSREDCEMKPVVSGSMGNEEIREGVVVLPPQHSTTPGLGRMPPYFGVVPWYLHYPQAPFPSQFGQNFNGVPNLNSDRNLSHLLQQFINNGSGTGGKPDHPQ